VEAQVSSGSGLVLSTTTIIGMTLGAVFGLVLGVAVLAAVYYCHRKNKRIHKEKRVSDMADTTETLTPNEKKKKAIDKLEEVLNILKYSDIKNEETLTCMDKPLDDLLSSLKFISIDSSFNKLPAEIKTNILSYLCDSGAFVAASVSKEWKQILHKRLELLENVKIGKHCTNVQECEDNKCFMAEEILKASLTLKLGVPLAVCHPLIGLDSSLVVKGLTSASKLSIAGDCDTCANPGEPVLTDEQYNQLIDGLENKEMKSVKLSNLDLRHLDQDRLVDSLVNNIAEFEFIETEVTPGDFYSETARILDVGKLIAKLKNSTGYKLVDLKIGGDWYYPDELSVDMADALCQLERVELGLTTLTIRRILENVLTQPFKMRSLSIDNSVDWRTLITPDNLKILLNSMEQVLFFGEFTPEQVEAARSCPQVNANWDDGEWVIKKI